MSAQTETFAFLFTDIEGSTRLWREAPEGMRPALEGHDAILREAIREEKGHLFKTVGDAFCAAFRDAPCAVRAALTSQIALTRLAREAGLELRVRMAVNVGAAQHRDGDYFGEALSRAARMLASVHGGQVLLSQSAWLLSRDSLPEGVSALDLGLHRLRDLPEPEPLYQLLHPELPSSFPPLLSVESIPHSLPRQLTSFIGREDEIARVLNMLRGHAMLTICGSGGCGKTRLALQASGMLLERYPDGVWFVDLSGLRDANLVEGAVAAACRLLEPAATDHRATLENRIRNRHVLVVLDNCEHLVQSCASLAGRLLAACPNMAILATSREPLGVRGEAVFRVPSLTYPAAGAPVTPEELRRYESARLFEERAALVRPGFRINSENAPSIALICRWLDGIPLAIELAAARIRSLSPLQISERLQDRFSMLVGGLRTVPPRQQTLRAALDWSYDLLTRPERALMNRLSVFAGGFTLTAAEHVCADEDQDPESVALLLEELVDKSLVVLEERSSGDARFRLLETVRAYAAERLEQREGVELFRTRHRDYYTIFCAAAETEIQGENQGVWLDLLEDEKDNIRAALAWSIRPAERLTIAAALWRFWYIRGMLAEGRGWLEGPLTRRDAVAPSLRGRALNAAGVLACAQGDYEAALAWQTEALALAESRGDRWGVAVALNNLGLCAWGQSEYAAARDYYERSLEVCRELGRTHSIAVTLNNVGAMARELRDFETARRMLEESLALQESVGDRSGLADVLSNLGDVARSQGNFGASLRYQERSLSLRREIGDRNRAPVNVACIAITLAAIGEMETAVLLFHAALQAEKEIAGVIPQSILLDAERELARIQEVVDPAVYAAWEASGRDTSLSDAIQLALSSARSLTSTAA